MPVKKLPFKSLNQLLSKCLVTQEEEKTNLLIKSLKSVKARGYLTKKELEDICRWKSPRAIHHINSNTPAVIRKITTAAFATRSERSKIELLTSLRGVSLPMASAILTLINPKKYGVIDIRVWELLFSLGTVKTKPKGVNFGFNEWFRLLSILRYYSDKYETSVRKIEYSIFLVHQQYQDGILYQNLNKRKTD